MEGLADISCCCCSMKCESRGGNGGIPQKYIDSDIIGRLGVLKNALLLLILIFEYIDTDIKNDEWPMVSVNKFRTIVIFLLYSHFSPLAKQWKNSKIIIDAYGSTGWENHRYEPFSLGLSERRIAGWPRGWFPENVSGFIDFSNYIFTHRILKSSGKLFSAVSEASDERAGEAIQ